MGQEAARAKGQSGVEDLMLHSEALTLARSGQLKLASAMSHHAVELAQQGGSLERAAVYKTAAAIWEALFGNQSAARRMAIEALDLSKSRDAEYSAAFALMLAKDTSRAQALANDLEMRFPEDTSVQFTYLPTLRALFALDRGDPAKAIEQLQTASSYELSMSGTNFDFFFGGLYSAYVRGNAYLALHQGPEAAAEFQKILDHPGLMFASDPVGRAGAPSIGPGLCNLRRRSEGTGRLSGLPHPLERRRSRAPHPDSGQSGIRKADLRLAASRVFLKVEISKVHIAAGKNVHGEACQYSYPPEAAASQSRQEIPMMPLPPRNRIGDAVGGDDRQQPGRVLAVSTSIGKSYRRAVRRDERRSPRYSPASCHLHRKVEPLPWLRPSDIQLVLRRLHQIVRIVVDLIVKLGIRDVHALIHAELVQISTIRRIEPPTPVVLGIGVVIRDPLAAAIVVSAFHPSRNLLRATAIAAVFVRRALVSIRVSILKIGSRQAQRSRDKENGERRQIQPRSQQHFSHEENHSHTNLPLRGLLLSTIRRLRNWLDNLKMWEGLKTEILRVSTSSTNCR